MRIARVYAPTTAVAMLAAVFGLTESTRAQLPPLPPGGRIVAPPAGARPFVPPAAGPMVRRVQATSGDIGGEPGGIPGAGPTVPPPTSPAASPVPNTTDLAAPAAEREFGGGEPTTEEAASESAGGTKEDSRGLLMKFLDIPEDSPIKIYGWIQNSFTGNPSQPSNFVNFGVNPNYKANTWMGNQYYTIIEKTLDPEKGEEWQWGFRADSLFGHDWQFNHMYGLFDRAYNPGQFTGWDPAQFYLEGHAPILTEGGVDFKFGRWYTLHGYEVVPAIARPLLSVPYMFNYGQPFTHVGLMTTWHYNDKINIYNGTTNGWDRFFDMKYKWGYMGGFAWTFGEEDRGNLTFIFSAGPNQFPTNVRPDLAVIPTGIGPGNVGYTGVNTNYNRNWRELWTTVLTWKWTDKLTQVVETDEAFERSVPGLGVVNKGRGNNQNAEWYSFGNWFLYSFNDKLTGVWRAEVFRDDDGVRTGFADNFYEQTLGLIWKPQPWLWVRPEARYDWAQFSHPYNGGVSGSQFTLGGDIILLY